MKMAGTLLIHTLASDDMFSYWSSCCNGSERVPKILRYIREISFDEALPTASIDLIKGKVKLGVDFFLEQIQAPEDLLFILIHERNHLILGKLYPEVHPANGYPPDFFNFAQDAYINAIGRRNIPSTLPERFYQNPLEMILTGRHSRIDWTGFRIQGDSNLVKEAHQGIYRDNYSLMQVLKERIDRVNFPGYKRWMDVMADWYQESRSQTQPGAGRPDSEADHGEEAEAPSQTSPQDAQEASDQASLDEDTQAGGGEDEPSQGDSEDQEGETDTQPDPQVNGFDEDDDTPEEETQDEAENSDSPQPEAETSSPKEAPPFSWKPEAGEVERVVKSYTPLVESPPDKQVSMTGGMARDENGLTMIPIPNLKPDDMVVELILQTSDLGELRDQVRGFEGEALQGVEKAIRGILSDQATEKAYQGYSVEIPTSISRKNLLSLSLGDCPILWDKAFELKAPAIDLYMDVSGSMNVYYGWIPYIYDALRGIRGRIFQFSTQVFEADPEDRFLHTTGGTDFNDVAEHILANETKFLILVSDGCGRLDKANLEALARQLEGLIYLKVIENSHRNWEEVASQTILLNT